MSVAVLGAVSVLTQCSNKTSNVKQEQASISDIGEMQYWVDVSFKVRTSQEFDRADFLRYIRKYRIEKRD